MMKIEAFANEIKKKNEIDRRWKWLSYLALYPMLFLVLDDSILANHFWTYSIKWITGTLMVFAAMVFFTLDFAHQYLYIKNSYYRFSPLMVRRDYEEVVNVMKMHAFSYEDYFAMIQRKYFHGK